jgi:transposase
MISPDRRRMLEQRAANPLKYEFDIIMEEYYSSLILRSQEISKDGMLLISKKGELEIYLKDNSLQKWVVGSKPDFKYFNTNILSKFFIPKESIGNTLAPYIGFITNISIGDYSVFVFKTKQISGAVVGTGTGASLGTSSSVVKGSSIAARCDQAGRAKIVTNMLLILTEERIPRILSRMTKQESEDYINYELEDEFKEILRKEGKLENSPAIKRLLTILGYSYEMFLDKYQKKTLSYDTDFMRIAKLFINRTKLVTPHIMESEVKNVESEIKKLPITATGASTLSALEKPKSKRKEKEKEKDISSSKVIKSMLNVIGYPEEDFFRLYKSNTLNYDDIHFPFNIKNNRNTTEVELCIMQEFLLRFYDKEREENKRWFFSPIEVLLNSI